MTPSPHSDPHRDTPVLRFGASIEDATGAVILLHGRGATAEDILSLAHEFYLPELIYLAPEAAGNSWYPNSFLAPIAQNEPWLSSALIKVQSTVEIATAANIHTDRIVVCGFSQGACLSTEFVARNPRHYAGLVAFTGGLIGPPEMDLTHTGDLAGTPALLASGDPDPHVPWKRVQQSAEVLAGMGATVTARRYPGRHHTIGPEELAIARRLVEEALTVVPK